MVPRNADEGFAMIREAFEELFPGREFSYSAKVRYSSRFSAYNATISLSNNVLEARLSRKWEGVSREIQIGLLQVLLNKLFKAGRKTSRMGLYEIFLKKVHVAVPKNRIDALLKHEFDNLNDKFFHSLLETPNLVWGRNSKTKLGSYEYGSDTITISSVLRNAPREFLRVVLYHEMLHKKLKFSSTSRGSRYHTPEFRRLERMFPEFERVNKELRRWLSRKRFFRDFLGID